MNSGAKSTPIKAFVDFIASACNATVPIDDFVNTHINKFAGDFGTLTVADTNLDIWQKFPVFLAMVAKQEPLIGVAPAILSGSAPYTSKILSTASQMWQLCSLAAPDAAARSPGELAKAIYSVESARHDFFEKVLKAC